MNILHTSDWHFGHRLHEQSQLYEQEKFLYWLLKTIKERTIHVLLVSGDIFDSGYPSSQSLRMFYNFLAKLYKTTDCQHVVITAGNHDAPGTINAPGELVRYFSINLIGKATDNIEDEIFHFNINGEKLIVAAVPFLRDRDIRRAIADENANDIETRYKTALVNHYNEAADAINKDDHTFTVAMGHLFAVGGQVSESENRIYVGGLGDISASDFPGLFDYVALGHLHRPQKVDKREHIRYSGSPYALSFGEAGSQKKVIVIKTIDSKLTSIDEINIPVFRTFYTITGNLEHCKHQLETISKHNNEAEPWVEVNINEPGLTTNAYTLINDVIEDKAVKVLKVRNISLQMPPDITQIEEEDRQLNELKPDDVFKRKCEEEHYNLNDNKQILDAFYEILNGLQNGNEQTLID